MRRYKHKQTGLIAQQLTVNYKVGECEVPGCIIEKSQDWEELIEKDYEVLISKVVPYTILSIKRLSDGEVFTVGDLIKTPYTESTPIIGFDTKYSTEYFIEVSTGFTRLLTLEKVKQAIFLTHDGKDIFEGDKVWYVNKESPYSSSAFIAISATKFYSDMNAYFLTQEAASEYISRNKVLFTTEDGVGIKRGDTFYFVDTDLSIGLSNTKYEKCNGRKYFSTFEPAQYYVIVNAKVLSIEEFWNFVSKPGSNVVKQKQLKRLVKERLNLK